MARNSVLTSTFDRAWKRQWLGDNYDNPNLVLANDPDKTNVSDVRTWFRYQNLLRELHFVLKLSGEEGDVAMLAGQEVPLVEDVFPMAHKVARVLRGETGEADDDCGAGDDGGSGGGGGVEGVPRALRRGSSSHFSSETAQPSWHGAMMPCDAVRTTFAVNTIGQRSGTEEAHGHWLYGM